MKKVIFKINNEGIRWRIYSGLMKDFKADIIASKKMVEIDDEKKQVIISGDVEGIFGKGLDYKKRYIERGIWKSLAGIGVKVSMEDDETKEVQEFKA